MPTKDGFTPDHPLPLFLSEERGQPDIGKAWDRAVISSRILKTSILVVTATAIAILTVENPVALFANVTASLFDTSAFQPGTGQSTPTIQSTADAKALPPTARDAPTRDEIAVAFGPANQSQTESSEPPAEDLLKQFQAWAAEEDVRAQVVPVHPVQPVQDAPVQVVQDARAEIRPRQNHRAKVRREQNARVQVPPVQDARAQDQSVQNAQAPSFLQSLGWRN